MTTRRWSGFLMTLFLLGATAAVFAQELTSVTDSTLNNLLTAFQRDNNAQAQYQACAKRADKDGLEEIASLFRAAAAGKKVQIARQAKIITSMGGTADEKISPPAAKATEANLQTALSASQAHAAFLTRAIEQAKAENLPQALRVLTQAQAVETEHAKFFEEVLNNLEEWRGKERVFYVCPVCGDLLTFRPGADCPVCDAPKENFFEQK